MRLWGGFPDTQSAGGSSLEEDLDLTSRATLLLFLCVFFNEKFGMKLYSTKTRAPFYLLNTLLADHFTTDQVIPFSKQDRAAFATSVKLTWRNIKSETEIRHGDPKRKDADPMPAGETHS